MTFAPSDHTFAVCAYKENPYLASTVESLLAQDARCPIIISTSTPNDHISAVARRFEVPVVVNPDPRGAASDWNYGYDAAETPLVTIAHQDDYYEPNYLSTMLAAVNDYEEGGLQLAFSDYFEIRNGERVAGNALLRIKRALNAPLGTRVLNGSRFVKRRALSLGNPICCPAVMLVKENLGPSVFDETYKNSCDYKTWVDLGRRAGAVRVRAGTPHGAPNLRGILDIEEPEGWHAPGGGSGDPLVAVAGSRGEAHLQGVRLGREEQRALGVCGFGVSLCHDLLEQGIERSFEGEELPELEFAVGRAVGRVVWVSFMKTSIETLVIGVQALSRFYASACGDAGAPFIKQNRAVQMMHVAIEQCYGFREILAVAYFIGFGEKSEQLLQASFLEKLAAARNPVGR